MIPLDPSLEGKRLYLMRHGKTYEPDLDAAMVSEEGDADLALTEDGVRGVESTANALAGLGLDAAYSSTFHRSAETARIVAAPHSLEVQTRAEFEELRLYPVAGGDLRATARRYIDLVKQLAQTPPHGVELDGGMTLGQVLEGAIKALLECLTSPGQRILIVAHGGINRLLLTQLMGIPLERFLSIDQDFACVNAIEFVRRGRPWVRAINATVSDPFKSGDILP